MGGAIKVAVITIVTVVPTRSGAEEQRPAWSCVLTERTNTEWWGNGTPCGFYNHYIKLIILLLLIKVYYGA